MSRSNEAPEGFNERGLYAACFDGKEIERFDTPWAAWTHLQNLKAIYYHYKHAVCSVVNVENETVAFTYRDLKQIWVTPQRATPVQGAGRRA